jgi:hypothetical protein
MGFVPRSVTIVVTRELNGLEVARVLDEAKGSFVSEIVGLFTDRELEVLRHVERISVVETSCGSKASLSDHGTTVGTKEGTDLRDSSLGSSVIFLMSILTPTYFFVRLLLERFPVREGVFTAHRRLLLVSIAFVSF